MVRMWSQINECTDSGLVDEIAKLIKNSNPRSGSYITGCNNIVGVLHTNLILVLYIIKLNASETLLPGCWPGSNIVRILNASSLLLRVSALAET